MANIYKFKSKLCNNVLFVATMLFCNNWIIAVLKKKLAKIFNYSQTGNMMVNI